MSGDGWAIGTSGEGQLQSAWAIIALLMEDQGLDTFEVSNMEIVKHSDTIMQVQPMFDRAGFTITIQRKGPVQI